MQSNRGMPLYVRHRRPILRKSTSELLVGVLLHSGAGYSQAPCSRAWPGVGQVLETFLVSAIWVLILVTLTNRVELGLGFESGLGLGRFLPLASFAFGSALGLEFGFGPGYVLAKLA